MQTPVRWMTAPPLWPSLVADHNRDALARPMLLRFASDTFMQDLQRLLAEAPETLATYEAVPESFQARPAGTAPDAWVSPPPPMLKLYQPAHGHFYLVAVSLVCERPGLPDRTVAPPQGERMGFVLRRVVNGQEHARLGQGTDAAWFPIESGNETTLLDGEELRPLVAMPVQQNGRTRRLLVGFLPTAEQETLDGAPALPATPPPDEEDPRMTAFNTRIISALETLAQGGSALPDDAAETASLFALLDLLDFFMLEIPTLHEAIVYGHPPDAHTAERALYDKLANADTNEDGVGDGWRIGGASWLDALQTVWEHKDELNTSGAITGTAYDLRNSTPPLETIINELPALVEAALPVQPITAHLAPVTLTTAPPPHYIVRCVYERPGCQPLPFTPTDPAQADALAQQIRERTVSAPSVPFTIAAFFDPDAPMRPVRITMPDTSLQNLRKYQQNVSIVLSKKLRQQICQLSGVSMSDIEDGDLNNCDTGFSVGMICSMSIPIITICALVLLLIVVNLLNIVFWWLPFFKICIPVPTAED